MKNKVILAIAAAALFFVGCAKDQALYNRVDDLENRVSKLEEYCKELNTLTIPSLQSIIASIEGKLWVTDVKPSAGGFTITFSDGTTATVEKGDKGDQGEVGPQGPQGPEGPQGPQGEKGDAPTISVVSIDGKFYWAINGEVLKDSEGNPMSVNGATPMFRINEGKWELSYDNGQTWTVVEQLGEAGGSTISIEDGETTVTFWINGEAHVIQKELPFSLNIAVHDRKDVGVPEGESIALEYTVAGAQEGDELEVDILSVTDGWKAKVVSLPKGENPGYITVTNLDNSEGKIFIYAANGKGKSDIKSLVFKEGVLDASLDVETVTAAGGNVVLTIEGNMEYDEVWINPLAKWLTVAPDTKAYKDEIVLVAAENTTGKFRSAQVDVSYGNSYLEFIVLQYPSPAVVTDLASLDDVEDYKPVELYNLVVAAASQYSVVVTDGKKFLYVPKDYYAVGSTLNISGMKTPDGFTVSSVSQVEAEPVEVTDPTPIYYGAGLAYDSPQHVFVTGPLTAEEGVLTLTTPMGDVVWVESPLESLGLDELVGKYVQVDGYFVMGMEDEENNVFMMIANSAKEFKAELNPNWKTTFNPNGSNASYPWHVETAVSAGEDYFCHYMVSEEDFEAMGIEGALAMGTDYLAYNTLYYYGPSYFSYYAYNQDGDYDDFKKQSYGHYYFFTVGVDENCNPTGKYSMTEYVYEEPKCDAKYEDYLGQWAMGDVVVTIAAKEQGSTYTFSGIKNQSYAGSSTFTAYEFENVEAAFSNGFFTLTEQKTTATTTHSSYGACDIYLAGVFKSGSNSYGAYPTNSKTPNEIARWAFENNALKVYAGNYNGREFYAMGCSWVIQSGTNAGKGNTFTPFTNLADMTKYEDNIPSELLGNWICPSATEGWEEGAETFTNWTMKLSKSGVGVKMENFDPSFDSFLAQYSLAVQAPVASYDKDSKTLTVADKTETGISASGASVVWRGIVGEYYVTSGIQFVVDYNAYTLSLAVDGYQATASGGAYSYYVAPLVFYKEGHVPSSVSACGGKGNSSFAKASGSYKMMSDVQPCAIVAVCPVEAAPKSAKPERVAKIVK
ncbi:MAG: PL29 family lyase N-terminal domain-containing protein [Bacteroidales bacterium]|nr:PL29 family lyase N-terminal domain-containing protein [Bacteroidales bacterium]